MAEPAPVALFVYKRPAHARRMLESLLRNPQAARSPLYLFCDGPRGEADRADVEATRKLVRNLVPAHARLIERESNLGLARSIIEGVSRLAGEHGRVIVIEDDLVLSPVVLEYFNDALGRYRDEERVMHVSGYMYPTGASLPETFFYREATCWGWATWARAWKHFEPDAQKIRRFVLERGRRREFDAEGSLAFFAMLENQIRGRIDSWAIRWYGSMRMLDGLALHPGRSLVNNTGNDGSGEHGVSTDAYDVEPDPAPVRNFASSICESEAALRALIRYRRAIRWRERRNALTRALRRWTGHRQ